MKHKLKKMGMIGLKAHVVLKLIRLKFIYICQKTFDSKTIKKNNVYNIIWLVGLAKKDC